FDLIDFRRREKPPYAILSHTWEEDNNEEVTFSDVMDGTGQEKIGYRKLRFCGDQAARDRLEYFWVDTCCIDKSNSSEHTEAIILMFQWYQKAAVCYAYLSNVSSEEKNSAHSKEWELQFKSSRWFNRGWTLQELIAPDIVQFFSKEWALLGDKHTLVQEVSDATGISIEALQTKHIFQLSMQERISWTKHRNTTRPEDLAYSLQGILDVQMLPNYGEGREKAMLRLQEEF
ncbi:hypothetical protein BU25DRAFT_327275, partial [Macroventuria anomochaeta]